MQDLFLKLSSVAGLAAARDPRAYVFRTAIHLAFDWRRSRRPAEPIVTEPAAGAQSALDGLIQAEELEQILDAMQELSAQSRQVLILHYLQHQDYAEIAEQMGKTAHQVRGLCAKGLTGLRGILGPAATDVER